MKIIDILNKISKNELPDKTRFKVYSSSEDKSFICEYDMTYPGTIWRICDERSKFNYKIDFMRILNYEVEVIEENKEIEELKANAYIEPNTLNEYRSCFAYGQKGLFHRWIIKHDVIYKDEYVEGLVEFENGHVAEVGRENIQFCDNKIKGYDFKEREEKIRWVQ